MENATKIPPETWLVVLQELCATPGVQSVEFTQFIPRGKPLMDALGNPVGNVDYDPFTQTFTPIEITARKAVKFLPDTASVIYTVVGTYADKEVREGTLIFNEYFMHYLMKLRSGRMLPIRLIQQTYNPKTGVYVAMTWGQPLISNVQLKAPTPNVLQ